MWLGLDSTHFWGRDMSTLDVSLKRLPGQHVGVLSRLVADVHNELGVSAYALHSMEPVDVEKFEVGDVEGEQALAVEGRVIKAKRDVRRLLFAGDDGVVSDEKSAIVSFYDEADDVSYLQIVTLKDLAEEVV